MKNKLSLMMLKGPLKSKCKFPFEGAQHAQAALEGAACENCEKLPIRVLRSSFAIFDEARAHHGVHKWI